MGNCQSAKYKCLQFGQQWFSQLQTQHLVAECGVSQAPRQVDPCHRHLGCGHMWLWQCGCTPGSMQGQHARLSRTLFGHMGWQLPPPMHGGHACLAQTPRWLAEGTLAAGCTPSMSTCGLASADSPPCCLQAPPMWTGVPCSGQCPLSAQHVCHWHGQQMKSRPRV